MFPESATIRPEPCVSPSTGESFVPADVPGPAARCVLCIDDDSLNLELLQRVLQFRPDCEVLLATQGAAGIELARRLKPDLIVLDLTLPDISGEEVMQALRAEPQTARIPLMIVSGKVAAICRQEDLRRAGASVVLAKPFVIQEFLNALDQLLCTGIPQAA